MGNGLLNLDFGSIIGGVGDVIDDLHTSKEEENAARLQDKALDIGLVRGQQEINKTEAQHKSIFVAGWRPAVGWVCVFSFAYKFIAHPLLCWAWSIAHALEWLGEKIIYPPSVNVEELIPILIGMLGLGGYRTYEKIKGKDTLGLLKKG